MSAAIPLAGRSVLLAGASGGIGAALAAELDRRGAVLTLVGRDAARLGRVAASGKRLQLDLRHPDACGRAVREACDASGHLDVVVNAVGVVAFGNVAELSTDTMEELFLTNTFVPMMLAMAALPVMGTGGAIVNIAGVIAEQNLPGMAAYGASKAAVRSFDEALSRELRRLGIRVIDARPPHTESGLATRPIQGTAPRMPPGLTTSAVATAICDALESTTTDLPSSAFG